MPVIKRTPTIGLKGRYTGIAPFNTVLLGTNTYTCIAIRKFTDIVNEGDDVFLKYYEPYGIADVVFAEHEVEGVNIITLQRNDGEFVFIPDAFIESFPLMNEVDYKRVSLLVDMGALPSFIDYTVLKAKVLSVIQELVNPPNPNVYIALAPTDGVISAGDHEVLEATRQAGIVAQATDYAERIRLQQVVDEQLILIEDLSNQLLEYSTDL